MSDELFPRLALIELGLAVGIFFLLGNYCFVVRKCGFGACRADDIILHRLPEFQKKPEEQKKRQKFIVHIGFSLLFLDHYSSLQGDQ